MSDRDRVDRDPVDRDNFIDLLRVVAVLVVVLGHWLGTTVIWQPGRIEGENALSVISETHLATWILQVMPLLFFVGGFSNSRSLARHGGDYLGFLRTRYERLLRPTLVFLASWLVIGVVAQLLPLPQPNVLEKGADIAALPFWFIGIYVIVVALAPAMWRLHGRYGGWVPVVMITGALVIDVLHHGVGVANIGVANYAFVWLLPHQLGFFYADGRLKNMARRVAVGTAGVGLAGLVVLTTVADYPTSMIGVLGEERWNTDPPSLPLVMMTLWLVGLALLIRPAATSWLRSESPRALVASLNRIPLTLYLWHVTAVTLAASVLYPLGFPESPTGSAGWWAARPLWIAGLVPALVALVLIFRRFETHPPPRRDDSLTDSTIRRVAAAFAVLSLGLGLLGFGTTGFDRILTSAGEGILDFTTNPAQNVVHMAIGLIALLSAYGQRPGAGLTTMLGATLYLSLGIIGWSDGIEPLAINPATAILHAVLGLSFLLLVSATRARNRTLNTAS